MNAHESRKWRREKRRRRKEREEEGRKKRRRRKEKEIGWYCSMHIRETELTCWSSEMRWFLDTGKRKRTIVFIRIVKNVFTNSNEGTHFYLQNLSIWRKRNERTRAIDLLTAYTKFKEIQRTQWTRVLIMTSESSSSQEIGRESDRAQKKVKVCKVPSVHHGRLRREEEEETRITWRIPTVTDQPTDGHDLI